MKKIILFVMTALLISVGMTFIFGKNGIVMAAKASEIRQPTSNNRAYKEAQIPSKPRSLFRIDPQSRHPFTDLWFEKAIYQQGLNILPVNEEKYPALLWHRFSLTSQPVFYHWIMMMWPLGALHLNDWMNLSLAISDRSVCNKKQVNRDAGAEPVNGL